MTASIVRHIAVGVRAQFGDVGTRCEPFHRLDVPALRLDHRRELLVRAAVLQGCGRSGHRLFHSGELQHLDGNPQTALPRALVVDLSAKTIARFDHFESRSDRPPKRFVHIRHNCSRFAAERGRDCDQRLSEVRRFPGIVHECGRSAFYIEDKCVRAARDFLRNDGRRDEPYARNRSRAIA